MRLFRHALIPFALLALAACGGEEEAAAEAPIAERSVSEVAAGIEAGELVVFDANSEATRAEHGIVPGARLLTSSSRYELSELPANTASALVFYCGNTDCRASDGAAERARENGYENVSVMRAGIAGWVEAGQATEEPTS